MAMPVKVRPQRSPAPPLPPFEALDRTHRQVLEILQQFDQLLDHIDDNGPDEVARASATEIMAFFNENARQHHADEERLVFPTLLNSNDPELVHHVKRLQQDHGWLEEDWIELGPQLQAVSEGYSWYELDSLRAGVGIFADLYRDHIGLEESMIYPHARRQAAQG